MGKEARQARRERERLLSSHPAAAVAAQLADDTFARQWQSAEADYGELISSAQPGRRAKFRLDVDEIHAYVDILRRTGYDWPPATYLPMSLLGAELVRNLLADLHAPIPGNEAELAQLDQLAMALSPQVATLAAWNRAPLVAAFDEDLASALIATPMTSELPHSLLQQLPTWAVFIPTPWLAADTGVYVTYDTAQITKDEIAFAGVENGVDDFVLLFVSREAERAVVVFVRCSERTIGASIKAQAAELEARTDRPTWLGGADAYFEDVLRRPYRQVVEEIMSLVLYLCSDEPDAVAVAIPRRGIRRRTATDHEPPVLEVGFRLGAALRAHRAQSPGQGEGRHASPLPHVRTAHWHTYWYGPRDAAPASRTAKLRWLAPILVNVHAAPLDVIVRPVHANAHPDPSADKGGTFGTRIE